MFKDIGQHFIYHFISADAVVWLLEHVEGIFTEKDAIEEILFSQLDEN